MFTKDQRQDVDNIERDYCDFKNKIGEQDEEIIERIYCSEVFSPVLCNFSIDDDEIDKLKKFSPWGYGFRLNQAVSTYNIDTGYKEAPVNVEGIIEMDLRLSVLKTIFDSIVPHLQSSSNATWLDIATNCGIIPLLLGSSVFSNIVGIDISENNIAKGNCLRQLAKISNTEFIVADAYDYLRGVKDGALSLISALGLFYHLSDPIGLMNLLYEKSSKYVLIDTIVHNFPFSGWIQTVSRHVKYPHLSHANDTRKILELHPTYRGLIDSLFQVGFETVVEYCPSAGLLDKFPSQIYKTHNRAFVLASK